MNHSHSIGLTALVLVLVFSLSGLAQREFGGDPPPPNYGGLQSITKWHRPGDDPNLSREVERFLKDCKKRFDNLWEHFGAAEKQRRMLAQPNLTPEQCRQVQKDFREHLKKVSSAASGLRNKMIPLMRGFENKKDLDWTEAATGGVRQPFKDEMDFVRRYIREAEARFYGRSSQVVYYGGLNVLICLYWVEEMSKQVRKDLDS